MSQPKDNNIFEERADYLELNNIFKWNVETNDLASIQDQLMDKRAKLLVGPRGTGKTHQMKYCYIKCKENPENPFAVYMSFGKYYFLEPLLSKSTRAIHIFHSWVLSKIALGIVLSLTDHKIPDSEIEELVDWKKNDLLNFIGEVETGIKHEWHNEIINTITYERIILLLEKAAHITNRKRIILLLDDAALTLTQDYLIEFFDIFRSLKTTKISPNAAVYPGTTQYGPRFHVGQDAQKIELWYSIEDANYLPFMWNIKNSRFPEITNISDDIITLFIYCAFGNPRAFIKFLEVFSLSNKGTTQSKFNNIIEDHVNTILAEYESITLKMPQYKSVINAGKNLFDKMIVKIETENKNSEEKQLRIGIQQEQETNILVKRMFSLLIEAGLLYQLPSVSHGEDRKYDRYIPHIAFFIHKHAFVSSKRGFAAKENIAFFNKKSTKHPIRRTLRELLAEEIDTIKLDLPQCSNCGANRITEEQKFCHICGNRLINQSNFEKCMDLSIEDLPLSKWRKDSILKQTQFRTIGDIISSEQPATELRKVVGIGRKRADHTYTVVIRFVDEFLT